MSAHVAHAARPSSPIGVHAGGAESGRFMYLPGGRARYLALCKAFFSANAAAEQSESYSRAKRNPEVQDGASGLLQASSELALPVI